MNITNTVMNHNDSRPNVQPSSNACKFTEFEFICWFYVNTIICLIGFLLNLINIAVFAQKFFSATVYTYLSAISFTDAFKLLLMSPIGLLRCAGHLENCNDSTFRQFRFYAHYFNNYFGHGMANSAETASAWLTVLVSIERYMAMKFPMQSLTYCRLSSGRMHVIIIILLSVAFNAPLFFTTRCSRKNITTETGEEKEILATFYTAFGKSTDYDIFTWFRFVLVQIIPLIALCIFNSLLLTVVSESYRKLRRNEADKAAASVQQELKAISRDGTSEISICSKQQRTAKQLQMERRQRAQTKLTLMQICVIFLFLIGQIPQAFSFEKIASVIMPDWCGKCCKFRMYYQVISILLSQIGFSLPFFIYFGLNRHFRKILLTCCKSKSVEQCATRTSRATIFESRVY